MRQHGMTSVGVVSDTHGLVRPQALEALRHCEMVIHAGDVGGPQVLAQLSRVAPTYAVRGNNDAGEWAASLPSTRVVEVGDLRLYVVHELADLDVDPRREHLAAVISGHSHKPGAELRHGVLYLNPGSAGPRRFKLPIAMARLHLAAHRLTHEIIELIE